MLIALNSSAGPIAIASFRRLYPADTYNLLNLPLGVSEQYAYQSIEANGSGYTQMEGDRRGFVDRAGLPRRLDRCCVRRAEYHGPTALILDLDTFQDIRELGFHVDEHVFPIFAILRLSTPECTVVFPAVLSRGGGGLPG